MPDNIKQLQRWWNAYPWIGAVVLGLIGLAIFAIMNATPTFKDPDSFYHLKIAEMIMKNRTSVSDFVWLPYTTLAHSYSDHHFLYHVALVPFIAVFGNVVGMKLLTVILGALTLSLIYTLLRTLQVRYASLYTLLLLTSGGFLFRMSLAKAPSVACILLITTALLLAQKNNKLLAILGFIYVWAYGGFILMLVLTTVYCTTQWAWNLAHRTHHRSFMKEVWQAYLPLVAAASGIATGLLIHPSFPTHLRFYWDQVVSIGVVNYQGVIGVGGEWLPKQLPELVQGELLWVLIVLAAFITFFATLKKQSAFSMTAMAMTLFFLFFTLKSQRYIEYLIPWGYIAVATTAHQAGIERAARSFVHAIAALWKGDALRKTIVGVCLFFFLFMMIGLATKNGIDTTRSLHDGIPTTRFAAASTWLRTHSTKGDIVFHNDWDDFPILFYHVPKDRYIAGLDPTFFYKENQDLYWKWVNITTGTQQENIFETIKKDFRARFVFIDHDHALFKQHLDADPRFIKVYEDNEAVIYRIPRESK